MTDIFTLNICTFFFALPCQTEFFCFFNTLNHLCLVFTYAKFKLEYLLVYTFKCLCYFGQMTYLTLSPNFHQHMKIMKHTAPSSYSPAAVLAVCWVIRNSVLQPFFDSCKPAPVLLSWLVVITEVVNSASQRPFYNCQFVERADFWDLPSGAQET